MFGWLQALLLDKRARQSLRRSERVVATKRQGRRRQEVPPPPVRDAATALAEAELRMQRLPPEKAQLIRCALLVHRVRQSVLGELSDEERDKLRGIAQKALLGRQSRRAADD
jgi:hypothetical protein